MNFFATRFAEPPTAPAEDAVLAPSDAITLPEYLPHRIRKPRARLIDQVPRRFSRTVISDFVNLIKTIPPEMFPRIERYIVRVFNGTADRDGFIRYLHRRCGVSEARARMIADDQIAKASEWMRIEKWRNRGRNYVRWVHGGANEPREYHLADWDGMSGADGRPNGLNGFVFEITNPPVIDLSTGVRGYPAQLVNCHCHLEPISAEEFNALAGAASAGAEAEYLAEVARNRGRAPVLIQPPPAA